MSTLLEDIKPAVRVIGLIAEDSAKVVGATSVGSNTLPMIFLSGEGGIAELRWKRPSE